MLLNSLMVLFFQEPIPRSIAIFCQNDLFLMTKKELLRSLFYAKKQYHFFLQNFHFDRG